MTVSTARKTSVTVTTCTIVHTGELKIEAILTNIIIMEKASLFCTMNPLLEKNVPCLIQCGKAIRLTPDTVYWQSSIQEKALEHRDLWAILC